MSAATRCQWMLLRSPRRAIDTAEPLHRLLAASAIASVPNLVAGQRSAGEVGSADSNKELAMPVVLIHQGPTVTAETTAPLSRSSRARTSWSQLRTGRSGASFSTQPAKARADSELSTFGSPRTRARRSASTWDRSSNRSALRIRRRCTRRRPSFRASPQLRVLLALPQVAVDPAGSRPRPAAAK